MKSFDDDYVVVPIPLSVERLRQRGFNQAGLLSHNLAEQGQCTIWTDLIRIRTTAAQAELGLKERQRNVRGAFRVSKRPAPKRVVLVDDVVTTGATLTQACRALKKAGTEEVWAVTIAHG